MMMLLMKVPVQLLTLQHIGSSKHGPHLLTLLQQRRRRRKWRTPQALSRAFQGIYICRLLMASAFYRPKQRSKPCKTSWQTRGCWLIECILRFNSFLSYFLFNRYRWMDVYRQAQKLNLDISDVAYITKKFKKHRHISEAELIEGLASFETIKANRLAKTTKMY